MSYVIEYQPEAVADLEKLTKPVCERIVKKINWVAENFDQINPQPLAGSSPTRRASKRKTSAFSLCSPSAKISR